MVAWVIACAILSIIVMPFIYFPLDYAWDVVYANITAGYTFTGTTALALTVVQLIISYLCAFGLIFTINWAIVQARVRSYPE
jgi:hypothetical protein